MFIVSKMKEKLLYKWNNKGDIYLRRKHIIIIPLILLVCLVGVLLFLKSRTTFYGDSYKRKSEKAFRRY